MKIHSNEPITARDLDPRFHVRNLRTSSHHYWVSDVFDQIESGQWDIYAAGRSPWDNRTKSLLIESLFTKMLPLPTMYLDCTVKPHQIIDGAKRVQAIYGYMKDEFALSDMEYWPDLNGLRYSDHSPRHQRMVKESILSFISVDLGSQPAETRNVYDRIRMRNDSYMPTSRGATWKSSGL